MEQVSSLVNQPITPKAPINSPIQPLAPKKPRLIFLLAFLFIVLVSLGAYGIFKVQTKSQTPVSSPSPSVQPSPTPSADVYTEQSPAPSSAGESQSETANWKEYTSRCGFEFKYPTTWKVEQYFILDSERYCGYLTGPDYTSGLDNRTGAYISLKRYLMGEDGINTLDDFIHISEKIMNPTPSPIKSESKTLGGIKVEEFSHLNYEAGVSDVFVRGNYIYEINRSDQTPEKYVDQILSTFRFD